MEIYPLGHSSFKIKGKTLPAGRQVPVLVTDPFAPAIVGLKFPKVEMADIVTVSHGHDNHNATQNIPGSPFIVSGPGEYEVKGVTVVGVPTFHDNKNGAERGKNTVYKITVDDVHLCHLGDLGHKLSDKELDQIGDVDILFLPVGGVYTIDAKTAAEVVAQLEPRIVIPMHYKRSDNPEEVVGQLAPLSNFLKEIGAESTTPQPKLVTSKDKLPETTTVVVLE